MLHLRGKLSRKRNAKAEAKATRRQGERRQRFHYISSMANKKRSRKMKGRLKAGCGRSLQSRGLADRRLVFLLPLRLHMPDILQVPAAHPWLLWRRLHSGELLVKFEHRCVNSSTQTYAHISSQPSAHTR